MFRLYFLNHRYFAAQTTDTFAGAVDLAVRYGLEVAIYRVVGPAKQHGEELHLAGSWSILGGLKTLEG